MSIIISRKKTFITILAPLLQERVFEVFVDCIDWNMCIMSMVIQEQLLTYVVHQQRCWLECLFYMNFHVTVTFAWRAYWHCRSQTSIFSVWKLKPVHWHSIAVLASLFRACPRPCPPVDIFAANYVSWHARKMTAFSSLPCQFTATFCTCDMNNFLVRDTSCPAYSSNAS